MLRGDAGSWARLYRRAHTRSLRSGTLDDLNETDSIRIDELIIPASIYAAMIAHLRAGLPNEGCGLLATVDHGSIRQVARWQPGNNIDLSPTRFTMDPVQVLAAVRENREHDWELGGIAHSHPRTEPRPSITDLREAYYQDALLVIVSFAGVEPELRAWDVRVASAPSDAREVAVRYVAD